MSTKTTTKIVWRLANRPTPDEVAALFDKGLLTKDEAREILFSLETEEDRDTKSLESEIKFLRELVQKLSNRTQIVETIREVYKPYSRYGWYHPYEVWCSTSGSSNVLNNASSLQSSLGSQTSNTVYLTAGNATGAIQAYAATPDFSAIKTF